MSKKNERCTLAGKTDIMRLTGQIIAVLLLAHQAISQCRLQYDGINKEGVTTIAVETEDFFSYTDEKLEGQISERDFVLGSGHLVKIGKNYYLSVKVTLATTKAVDYYGEVEETQPLKLVMLNGDHVYCNLVNRKLGRADKDRGTTEYEILAFLDKSDLRALCKKELDTIGIVWTSGYEEYEIYRVDLIKQQYKCLKNHS